MESFEGSVETLPSLPSLLLYSMSQPAPSIVDRTKNWIRLLKRQSRSPAIRPDEKTGGGALIDPLSLSTIC
jgi:hypothetical protein